MAIRFVETAIRLGIRWPHVREADIKSFTNVLTAASKLNDPEKQLMFGVEIAIINFAGIVEMKVFIMKGATWLQPLGKIETKKS